MDEARSGGTATLGGDLPRSWRGIAILFLAATWIGPGSGVSRAFASDTPPSGAAADLCTVRVVAKDASGVAEIAANCHWPVPHGHVAEILRDQGNIADVLSSVSESTLLADGRVLQVHSLGFGIADRQVTLAFRIESLEDSGIRLHFDRAPLQEQLQEGRVEIRVDTGFWRVSSDGGGGTRLDYSVRYDPGGNLAPWLVTRFMRSGVERAMAEVRRAAERRASSAALGRISGVWQARSRPDPAPARPQQGG